MIEGFQVGLVIETRSLPALTRCYPCSFTFYVADPISSIPDLWQQDAVRALQQGKDVVVQAPTGRVRLTAIPNLGARPPAQARPRPAVMLALANAIFELLYPNHKTQAVFTVPTARSLTINYRMG